MNQHTMHDHAPLETDLLTDLIGAKREVLENIRELGRRQIEYISGGEMTKLMNVLATKETFIRRLLELEKRLDPFRNQDPDSRVWRSIDDRRRCQSVAERCESLLGEIMMLEKNGETDLQRRRDQTASQLQSIESAVEARHAYGVSSVHGESQLDLSSEV